MQLQKIEGELGELGYQLVAVTADLPADLVRTREKHRLSFPLFSDAGFDAARAFGIAFQALKKKPLPVPAVFIIGADGKIRFQHVDPNYKVRLHTDVLLAVARAVRGG